VRPIALATRRNVSVVDAHSPGGATAGSFHNRYMCPYPVCRSMCSVCIVAGSTMSA